MALDYSRFKEQLSESEVKRLEEQHKAGGPRSDIPSGTYPVRLSRMEVKENKFGGENINISFKITDGERKGQLIFYNGSFNEKPDSGYRATARLISQLTDRQVDEVSILKNITNDDHNYIAEYIDDLFEFMGSAYEYDLDYKVVPQTDINPTTGKPYGPNRFFSITDVYDI